MVKDDECDEFDNHADEREGVEEAGTEARPGGGGCEGGQRALELGVIVGVEVLMRTCSKEGAYRKKRVCVCW